MSRQLQTVKAASDSQDSCTQQQQCLFLFLTTPLRIKIKREKKWKNYDHDFTFQAKNEENRVETTSSPLVIVYK